MTPGDNDFKEICPAVWLMDSHGWAYYIWEKASLERPGSNPFVLFHVDFHWDGLDDFHDDPVAVKRLIEIRDMSSLYSVVRENLYVREDSFIAPAIIRGLVNEVHFYCKQDDDTEPGLYSPFLKEHNAKQFMHDSLESLISHQTSNPYIFDIDLDIFNKAEMWGESDLWPDQEIIEFLSTCSGMVRSASIITAAMSSGHSGSEEDARHLANLFTPLVKKLRD